jgi:hypothetical protein
VKHWPLRRPTSASFGSRRKRRKEIKKVRDHYGDKNQSPVEKNIELEMLGPQMRPRLRGLGLCHEVGPAEHYVNRLWTQLQSLWA